MKNIKNIKPALLGLFCLLNLPAIAQNLPNVQEGNLPAPDGVKIDGQAGEWGPRFRAYNKNMSIFYTLANDGNNLYLVIRADSKGIIEKIIMGNITFKISSSAKDKTDVPFAVTYPLITANTGPIIKQLKDTSAVTAKVLTDLNAQLQLGAKEIRVAGNKSIFDSLISVYNRYGIRASSSFDGNKSYTAELALPLKYLNGWITSDGTLKYSIQLNGVKLGRIRISGKDTEMTPEIMAMLGNINPIDGSLSMLEMSTPTNLSGMYKLSK